MQREITPLWGEKKVVLRPTLRAVTPFGGLSVFIEFLGKIGFAKQVSQDLPVHLKSPNAIGPAQTLTTFLMSVLAMQFYEPLRAWQLARLPKRREGYSLDSDSSGLLNARSTS